nr:chemotaxis protein CheW [uncultured Methanospirillum sp.]
MAQILHFVVEGVQGALPLDESMYLVRMAELDPPPSGSSLVAGTLNLHGIRIPVYSLRTLFGLPERYPRLNDSLIIAKTGTFRVALWVDETYVVQESTGDEILAESPVSSAQGVSISKDAILIHDLPLFLESCRTGENAIPSYLSEHLEMLNHQAETGDEPCDFVDSEKIRQQLSERATVLARPEEGPPETSSIEVIKFRLVYRDYAAEMRFVREVVLTREITPVPTAPDHIVGVCPVRGEIIPLVDLRVLLSIPEKGLTDLNQVIVLTDGHITFGILADQITGISLLPVEEIQKAGPEYAPGEPNYIFGVVSSGLMVINAAAILSDPKMIVDQSGESEHPVTAGQRAW